MRKKQTVKGGANMAMLNAASTSSSPVQKEGTKAIAGNKDAKMAAEDPIETKVDETVEEDMMPQGSEEETVDKEEGEANGVKKGETSDSEYKKEEANEDGDNENAVEEESKVELSSSDCEDKEEKTPEIPVQKRGRGRPRKPETTVKTSDRNSIDRGGDTENEEEDDTTEAEGDEQLNEKRKRGRPKKTHSARVKKVIEVKRRPGRPPKRKQSTKSMDQSDEINSEQELKDDDGKDEKPSKNEHDEDKTPRKRGRPRKTGSYEGPAIAEKSSKSEVEKFQTQLTEKRGRGRPRKMDVQNKKRGRPSLKSKANINSPPVNADSDEDVSTNEISSSKSPTNAQENSIVRKRGRPPKKIFHKDSDYDEGTLNRSRILTGTPGRKKKRQADESETVNIEETVVLVQVTPEKTTSTNGDITSDEDAGGDSEDSSEESTEEEKLGKKMALKKNIAGDNLSKGRYKPKPKCKKSPHELLAEDD